MPIPSNIVDRPMEKINYEITPVVGDQWYTKDADIAKTAFIKGCQVVEIREYATYSEYTVVRVAVSTQITSVKQGFLT